MVIVITCEHGGNQIPEHYRYLFKGADARLETHEGLDLGGLALAKSFAAKLANYFFYTEISRLLIELNRSLNHPHLFSDFTRNLDVAEKNKLIETYYLPYRNEVLAAIDKSVSKGNQVLHLSVHSFTPIFNKEERTAAIGFLYDPRRECEKQFCKAWKQEIYKVSSDYKVRYNYPYLGKSDGFVTSLRKRYDCKSYIGLELEVNQKLLQDKNSYRKIENLLIQSFADSMLLF